VIPSRLFALCRCLFFVLSIGLVGCSRDEPPIGVVGRTQATVERDHAEKVGAFEATHTGDEVFVGDGVRTGAKSTASVKLGEGSEIALEEKTLIRFLASKKPGRTRRLNVEMGQASVSVGDAAFTLETSFGDALIQPNSKLLLTRGERGIAFEVAIGSAELEVGGKHQKLEKGTKIEIGMDLAIIEPAPSTSGAPPDAAVPDPVEEDPSKIGVEINGDGAQVKAPGAKEFTSLAPGASTLAPGSTLKLSSGTSAHVQTASSDTTLSGPGEFDLGNANDLRVRTKGGTIVLAPKTQDSTVQVNGGQVVAHKGSRARLATDKTGTQVTVSIGDVDLRGTKNSETLRTGEEGRLENTGRARRTRSLGLGRADLLGQPGDSLVVHDPRPPTTVGFAIPEQCEGRAIVELDGAAIANASGEKVINVAFGSGSRSYRVRCVDQEGNAAATVGEGNVIVLADAGTRRLPTSAPATNVDTDGRTYTVLYQNRLPRISVQWSKAPEGGPFKLQATHPGGRSETLSSATPSYAFSPGALAEGVHQFTFSKGDRRSRVTTVNVRFDNASPTASLSSPGEGSFAAGSTVTLSGTALPGWTVSAEGTTLPLDGEERFSGQVAAPGGRALAIRFSHPQRGTHIYLRRPSGAR
jgi:hypothetical protein